MMTQNRFIVTEEDFAVSRKLLEAQIEGLRAALAAAEDELTQLNAAEDKQVRALAEQWGRGYYDGVEKGRQLLRKAAEAAAPSTDAAPVAVTALSQEWMTTEQWLEELHRRNG